MLSPDVEQVVLTALAKDPKERFATVAAFARALEQAHWPQPPEPPAGTTLLTYRGHADPAVNVVAWSPDGRRIASASRDNTAQVWDAATGVALLTYGGHSASVYAVAWSPDGRRIASGSEDKTV